MISTNDLEDRIRHLRVTTSDAVDRRILTDASVALLKSQSTLLDAQKSSIRRIIMRNQWVRLAAALLVAVTFGVIVFQRQFATVAYALEQTIEANLGLRSIHIRVEPAGSGMRESWAEFGEDGKLLRMRMHFPKTEDGEKEVVWEGDKAEVWFKAKGHVLVIRDRATAEKLSKELASFDPKEMMEQLYEAQSKGKVRIETQEPSQKDGLIALVVSSKDVADTREVLQINPQTKLVEQIKRYRLVAGKYELMDSIEFLEYNQSIPPATFVLNTPADVTRVDWTTQEVGLPRGDLSDGEIAVKVARAFFEALIAKDYSRAGSIYSGMPASTMQEVFGKIEFLRIVAVGEPTPHPDVRTRFLQVPCEVEFRVDGQTHIKKFMPNIRAVDGQPDRWLIGGGI
jgi:hypothetical protein